MGCTMSVPSAWADSGNPTFMSSWASHLRVVSSFLRHEVNCGLRSSSGRHDRRASLALRGRQVGRQAQGQRIRMCVRGSEESIS